MKHLFLILLFGLMAGLKPKAQLRLDGAMGRVFFQETEEGHFEARQWWMKENAENPRLVAIVLDATLGLFGVHRMYLGTAVMVPVFYTLTAGGGGMLWLIDLGLLIGSKDIEPFYDNPYLFMWREKPLAEPNSKTP
ncbi:MAG: hypothetical protein RLZZ77_1478 [Bacteroidota bacterium]